MGQTATLLKRVQAVSYTEASSDQTHRSRTSPRPSGRRLSRSPNGRTKDAGRDNHGQDTGGYREAEAQAWSGSKPGQGSALQHPSEGCP